MVQAPEATCEICLSNAVFALEAIKRAAYQLSNELTVDISPRGPNTVCTLRAVNAKGDLAQLEDSFRNAVLDYDLRLRIAEETAPLRNLVLSLAFSKTGLQG